MTILVRFAKKRLTAWEGDRPPEEIQKIEFSQKDGTPDLRPSVYRLEDLTRLVQAYAEHVATPPIDPDTSTIGIDCINCGYQLDDTDGSPFFSHIREAHREILVDSAQSLLRLIVILKGRCDQGQKYPVTKGEAIRYAKARVRAADAEWLATIAHNGPAKRWLRDLLTPDVER